MFVAVATRKREIFVMSSKNHQNSNSIWLNELLSILFYSCEDGQILGLVAAVEAFSFGL
jgi:hypothetical protein